MRITPDTSVLVSAFIAKHGRSADLLELALTVQLIRLVLSDSILREFSDVLMRAEVRSRFAYTYKDVKRIVNALRESAEVILPKSTFKVVKDDPKDNVILNTAHDGHADYIVSSDMHLLKMGSFKGIKIVNPRRMMDIIYSEFPNFVFRL